ncbi:MAG TPA: hypothetical protein VLI41_12875 [Phenylobacterium sp.]|uniref:hypothetical protein n=1 Tax=Phenylobacterium sp. TaxID=1871053 RepID=UPI002B99DCAA|nr:hypothetical protein [Phenylobacterium sp.]HSV04088.1 hypothetical protein [Phenylobacterium sp.]
MTAAAAALCGCLATSVAGAAVGVTGAAVGVAGKAVGETVHVGHVAVDAATGGGGKSDKPEGQ